MTAIEQVNQLKSQGYQDAAIISYLQEQGVSPKEIQDAIDQSNIKDAVQQNQEAQTPNYQEQYQPPQPQQQIYEEDYPGYYPEQTQQPQTQETYQNYYQNPQQGYSQNYNQSNYQDQYYQEQGYGYGNSTSSVAEIAEQVFSEKIKEIEKQLNELNEFKTLMQTKVEHNSQRLKKIESTIDKLQLAILEKIGSYGQNLNSIKKEMSMMQDSFRKMVDNKVSRR